jgi:hypothetical protein
VQELAAQLSLEARKPDSRYRPYLESLASLTHSPILSWESFPPSYLHLLQDAAPLVGPLPVSLALNPKPH